MNNEQLNRTEVSAAASTPAPHAPHDRAAPPNFAPASDATSDAGDASVASPAAVTALANALEYTLTVGQARELFAQHNRKVPAERTLQNYCGEAVIAAQKIRTTYGSEWLLNEESLLLFIRRQPVLSTATSAPHAPHDRAVLLNDAPASAAASDAGDASAAEVASVGERRSLADVLIENARLLATTEGKDNVIAEKQQQIAELREDRGFLREEIREARRNRDDVKNIAERMLDTLKTMALGRLGVGEPERPEPRHATVFQTDTDRSQ